MDIRNLHKNGSWNAPYLPVWRPEDGPHPRKRPRSLCFEALLALLMLMMVACTAVKDPSARWKTSGMDPKLEGEWKEVKKSEVTPGLLSFSKHEGDWYSFRSKGEHPAAVRTFERGGRFFMLVVDAKLAEDGPEKTPEDKQSGSFCFYELTDDTLRLFMLDDKMVKAIKDGRIKGETHPVKTEKVNLEHPSLATLDDATCDALVELAKDKDALKLLAEYKREPKK